MKDQLILDQIKVRRLKGDHRGAFAIINDQLKRKQSNVVMIVEAIHQAILLGQTDLALKLHNHLQAVRKPDSQLRPEVLLRLHINAGDLVEKPDLDQVRDAPGWCREYLQTGTDPLTPLEALQMDMTCQDGTTTYFLEARCPFCSVPLDREIPISIMVYKEMLCPECLASLFLDFETLAGILENKLTPAQEEQMARIDAYLRRLKFDINFDVMNENRFPLLCQYLNLDYAFMLNQRILKRLQEQLQIPDVREPVIARARLLRPRQSRAK